MVMKEVVEELKNKFKDVVHEVQEARETRYVVYIEPYCLREMVEWLFNEKNARLCTISAVDLGVDFELIYHMTIGRSYVNLKFKVPKEKPTVDSITPIIPGAGMIEREVQDMFGIRFEGHPDPRHISLPFEAPEELKPLRGPMKGPVTDTQKPGIEGVLTTGLRFPLTFAAKRQRVKLGLPEAVKCTAVDPASLTEVQKLMKDFKFDEKVKFDWGRKKLRY